MIIEYSAYILPHIGDKFSQCADRFSCGRTNNSFAIADGVGNSLFPGEWATLLCDDFVENPVSFLSETRLIHEDSLIEKWEKQRADRIKNLTEDEKFIYEMGLEKADFAACTFVGLLLEKEGWKCSAIGDSYLFILDNEFQIIDKIASMVGHEFDNFPEYFASKKGENNGTVVEKSGVYENVSFFVLMTDALSDWFIDADPSKRETLLMKKNHPEFEEFVNAERQSSLMKDDDTTMVVLRILQDDSNNISLHENQVDNLEVLISSEETERDFFEKRICSINEKDVFEEREANISSNPYPEEYSESRNKSVEKLERDYKSIKSELKRTNQSKRKLNLKISRLLDIIDNLLKILKNGTSDERPNK
ncbi:MAG: hypothetical protein IKH59_08570 [Bacteroidaceae bacterium]|nr:hypothetical protein [Bacteroidaceae bacterium]